MKKIITAIALLALVGCGGGSNNDQGTSLTLLGYSTSCAESAAIPNLGGLTIPLSTDTETEGNAGGVLASLIVSNNLTSQFVRLDRVFLDYYIPGASIQPPSTSLPTGLVVGAAVGGGAVDGGAVGGGAVDGGVVVSTTGCVPTFVVSSEVRQWLILNRNSLPEPPYTMEITSYVTAISQAGDRFDTNIISMPAQITPDVIITPEGEGGIDDGTGVTPDLINQSENQGTDSGVDVGLDENGDSAVESEL